MLKPCQSGYISHELVSILALEMEDDVGMALYCVLHVSGDTDHGGNAATPTMYERKLLEIAQGRTPVSEEMKALEYKSILTSKDSYRKIIRSLWLTNKANNFGLENECWE